MHSRYLCPASSMSAILLAKLLPMMRLVEETEISIFVNTEQRPGKCSRHKFVAVLLL